MIRDSTINMHIPGPLRAYCEGASVLSFQAATVRAALEVVERAHPALYRNICDETGALRRHINVFVNDAHMRERDGLDTPLAPGDAIIILPAVSGG